MSLFSAGITTLMLVSTPVAAADIIVNLPSQTATPVPVTLEPGVYDLVPIGPADGGSFAAWNPWGDVSACDANGANCDAGYLHAYYSTGAVEGGYVSPGRFQTDQLALDHALTFTINLPTGGTVNFYIGDSVYGDNLGGISLRIVGQTAGVPDIASERPTLAAMRNPFPPDSEIGFSLPAPADIRLDVFEITGRQVTRLAEGEWPAGNHVVRWDGRDDAGVRAAAGIYLLRLDAGATRVRTRVALVR